MRLLHLIPLAAGLVFATPALASDADPDPATCKGIAATQFGAAGMELSASGLALAFTPEDEDALLIQAKARKRSERATALGYAFAGEAVPPDGEDYLGWQISRLDTVFANCERKYAALLQASGRQKWVVLELGNQGTALAVDVLNIRQVGTRRTVNMMVGFAEPFDGGDGRYYSATVDTFSFDCAARGNAIATLQIVFDGEFEQASLALTADPFPYRPGTQLAYYEGLACGDVTPGSDRPSAPDMVSAARLAVSEAAAQ